MRNEIKRGVEASGIEGILSGYGTHNEDTEDRASTNLVVGRPDVERTDMVLVTGSLSLPSTFFNLPSYTVFSGENEHIDLVQRYADRTTGALSGGIYKYIDLDTEREISNKKIIGPYKSVDDATYSQRKEKVMATLKEYLRLEPDWDGYGGHTPSDRSVLDANIFLKALPRDVVLPHPTVSGDGEVGLFWHHGEAYVDMVFPGNDLVYFYAKKYNGEEVFGDDEPFSESQIPEELLAVLKTLHGNDG